jgi:hypothetical protein
MTRFSCKGFRAGRRNLPFPFLTPFYLPRWRCKGPLICTTFMYLCNIYSNVEFSYRSGNPCYNSSSSRQALFRDLNFKASSFTSQVILQSFSGLNCKHKTHVREIRLNFEVLWLVFLFSGQEDPHICEPIGVYEFFIVLNI